MTHSRPLLAMWFRRGGHGNVWFKRVDTIIVAVFVLFYNVANWVVLEQ